MRRIEEYLTPVSSGLTSCREGMRLDPERAERLRKRLRELDIARRSAWIAAQSYCLT